MDRPSGPESIRLPYADKSVGIGSEPRDFYKPGDECEFWVGAESEGCFYQALVLEHVGVSMIHVAIKDDRFKSEGWSPDEPVLFMATIDTLRPALQQEGIRN